MNRKPLIETNPYLKDPIERRRLILRSVESSCRVEGIDVSLSNVELPILEPRPKRLKW